MGIGMTTGMGLRLELFVTDMDASIAFYRRVLGFALVRREWDYASVRSGNVTFGLGPVAKLPEGCGKGPARAGRRSREPWSPRCPSRGRSARLTALSCVAHAARPAAVTPDRRWTVDR
jgi:catechol 2,3-dioxygenase-like lactoylglutathione lyase family enzyme